MNRITVDQVKAAYAATGLNPLRRSWYRNDATPCACPVAACCIEQGVDAMEVEKSYESEREPGWGEVAVNRLGIRSRYLFGFANGVDGVGNRLSGDEYMTGYADGQAVAAAIFGDEG